MLCAGTAKQFRFHITIPLQREHAAVLNPIFNDVFPNCQFFSCNFRRR